MAKKTRNLVVAVAVASWVCTAAQPATAQDEQTTVVLHIDDYAHVDPSDLAAAKQEVARVYTAAGIQIIWDGRLSPDAHGDGRRHVMVVILSCEMCEIAKEHVGDDVLGRAARSARRAYIFHHRVVQTSRMFSRDLGTLLGTVIAHEVGHLLLPENSHSSSGIMRADLDLRGFLPQRFTPRQSATIRTILAADVQVAAR